MIVTQEGKAGGRQRERIRRCVCMPNNPQVCVQDFVWHIERCTARLTLQLGPVLPFVRSLNTHHLFDIPPPPPLPMVHL